MTFISVVNRCSVNNLHILDHIFINKSARNVCTHLSFVSLNTRFPFGKMCVKRQESIETLIDCKLTKIWFSNENGEVLSLWDGDQLDNIKLRRLHLESPLLRLNACLAFLKLPKLKLPSNQKYQPEKEGEAA